MNWNGKNSFNTIQAYVLNPKTRIYDPINLIATDCATCMNCGKLQKITEMETHLLTHANQNNHFNNHSYKLPAGLSLDQTFESSRLPSDISIESVSPDELAKPCTVRKTIPMIIPPISKVPSFDRETLDIESISKEDAHDLSSYQPQLQVEPVSVKKDQYYESIQIVSKTVSLNSPRAITTFKKQNRIENSQVDDHVDPQRRLADLKSQKQLKKPFQIVKQPDLPQQPKRKKIIYVNERTVLKPALANHNRKENVDNSNMPALQNNTNTNQVHDHNTNSSCSGCGGFYCPVCKSTIPPEFRRPPTKDSLQSTIGKSRYQSPSQYFKSPAK